jgi:hypothetical protein
VFEAAGVEAVPEFQFDVFIHSVQKLMQHIQEKHNLIRNDFSSLLKSNFVKSLEVMLVRASI